MKPKIKYVVVSRDLGIAEVQFQVSRREKPYSVSSYENKSVNIVNILAN